MNFPDTPLRIVLIIKISKTKIVHHLNIGKNLLTIIEEIEINHLVKIDNNHIKKTEINISGNLTIIILIKINHLETIKIITPRVVDISLHTQQASLINLEFTIIRVGQKIDQTIIDTIAITKLTGPVVTKGKSIIINTTIDHGTETEIVIAAIEPQTAQAKEKILGKVAVDKVPEYTL